MELVRAVAVGAVVLLGQFALLLSAYAAHAPKERYLFLQRYAEAADFALQRGAVTVWEPVAGQESTGPRGNLVEFKGVLDQESSDVLMRLLERRSVAYLSLDSPGGLVDPTLRLGQLAKAKKVATIVEGGKQCFSACALLFLAGEVRILGGFAQQRPTLDRTQGVVGFHAPYIPLPDGTARYLQDTKSSSVCTYLKKVMGAKSAGELCDYSLATKGMASFSLDLGRELGVFTAGEDEVMAGEVTRVQAKLGVDEGRWVACQRYVSYALGVEKLGLLSAEYKRKSWPCWATAFGRGPNDAALRVQLQRISQFLGPAPLSADLWGAALSDAAAKLEKMGLSKTDRQYIACKRADLYQQQRFPLGSSDPEAGTYARAWGHNCLSRIYDAGGRMQMGVGLLYGEQIEDVRDFIASQRGPEWFPADFVPLPPDIPLPKGYE
jgi:hypothetical protein